VRRSSFALVLIVAAVGCDDDAPATREAYVANFERLCLQIEADIVDLSERYIDPDDTEQLRLAREQAEVTTRFTDGIAALDPPAELSDDHDELLGYIAAVAEAGASGDFDAMQQASSDAEELIAEMGVAGCS